jgi:GT2 family glycosyltransferase
MARLAAIVLNYRTPIETRECARALVAAARPPDDLIVVDNGSGDGSDQELRAALPGARVVQTGANRGFSGGINAGIACALDGGADTILLANSDVRAAPDCVGRLESALAARADLGVVGPALIDPDDRIESLGISFSFTTGRVFNRGAGRPAAAARAAAAVEIVDGVSGCLMLVKRAVFERIGLFEERYFYSFEDLDFCLRARAAGWQSACVAGAEARHEGARTIGARSPQRIYFATRNHLLLAGRAAPARWPLGAARAASIVALNFAHVVFTRPAPVAAGLRAFTRGLWDHLRRRYGAP